MKRAAGIAIALVGVAAAILALLPGVSLTGWMLGVVEWIRDAGAAGVVVFALVYGAAAVLMLPGSVLTLAAGFAYGPLWGTLLVWPVSTVAAVLAFALGRTLLRGWITRRVAASPRFAAVDHAVADEGGKIVFLLRLSPIFPFNLLNYMLGLTRIRLRSYTLASLAGMLPGTILYVYLGSLVTSATQLASGEKPSGGAAQTALYWGGLVAALIVTVLVTRIARKALRRTLPPAAAAATASQETPR